MILYLPIKTGAGVVDRSCEYLPRRWVYVVRSFEWRFEIEDGDKRDCYHRGERACHDQLHRPVLQPNQKRNREQHHCAENKDAPKNSRYPRLKVREPASAIV